MAAVAGRREFDPVVTHVHRLAGEIDLDLGGLETADGDFTAAAPESELAAA